MFEQKLTRSALSLRVTLKSSGTPADWVVIFNVAERSSSAWISNDTRVDTLLVATGLLVWAVVIDNALWWQRHWCLGF